MFSTLNFFATFSDDTSDAVLAHFMGLLKIGRENHGFVDDVRQDTVRIFEA